MVTSQGIKPLGGCVTIYGHLRQCAHHVLMFATASLVIVTRVYSIRFTHNLSAASAAALLTASRFLFLDRVLRHSKSQCRVLSAVFENASSSGNAVTSACARCHSPSRIVCGFSWNSFVGAGRHDGHTATCCCAASGIPAAQRPSPFQQAMPTKLHFFKITYLAQPVRYSTATRTSRSLGN